MFVLTGKVSLSALQGDAFGMARVNFACSAMHGAGLDLSQVREVPSNGHPDPLICDAGTTSKSGVPLSTTLCVWMDDTLGVVVVIRQPFARAERLSNLARAAWEK